MRVISSVLNGLVNHIALGRDPMQKLWYKLKDAFRTEENISKRISTNYNKIFESFMQQIL